MFWEMVDVLHELRSQKDCRQSCCEVFMACSPRSRNWKENEGSKVAFMHRHCLWSHERFKMSIAGLRILHHSWLDIALDGGKEHVAAHYCIELACCQALVMLWSFVSVAAIQERLGNAATRLEAQYSSKWHDGARIQGRDSALRGPKPNSHSCASHMIRHGRQS